MQTQPHGCQRLLIVAPKRTKHCEHCLARHGQKPPATVAERKEAKKSSKPYDLSPQPVPASGSPVKEELVVSALVAPATAQVRLDRR
jgi:hypothetical protein